MRTLRWYDKRDWLQARLSVHGLRGLNTIVRERYIAGYSREERLGEFIVLGRWWMDTCGNTGKVTVGYGGNVTPRDIFPNISPVMTRDDFWGLLERSGNSDPRVTISMGHDIPPVGIVCPVCKNSWNLENAHDCERHAGEQVISLEDHVGKPLVSVVAEIDQAQDLQCWLAYERFLRNDRHIDLTPVPGYETLKVNGNGWVGRDEIDPSTYIIRPGDEMAVIITRYYHPACHQKMLAQETHTRFRNIFRRAGFSNKLLSLRTVPNEYGSEEYCGPWFVVGTPLGSIQIGWRKRVIEIDWSEIGVDLKHLFRDQDVTKEATLIHAWDEEDAVEYLRRIREALLERQRRSTKPKRRR